MAYRQLLERWKDELTGEQLEILRKFSREMDRNSLWLGYVDTEPIAWAYFTDEADWYRFSFDQMEDYLSQRERGRSFDWPNIETKHRLEEPPAFIDCPGSTGDG